MAAVETIGSGRLTGQVYLGDNLNLMKAGTVPEPIKMIYMDPPFEVGSDFYFQIPGNGKKIVAYNDKWTASNTYMDMMVPRLKAMYSLLADDGCLFFHCDWRLNARIRFVLDDIFGRENFLNEIIWAYRSGGASRKESLARKHDTIFFYRKSKAFRFHALQERQYLEKPFMQSRIDGDGRYYVDTLLRDVLEGELTIVNGDRLEKFNVRPVLNVSSERLGYPTQKPIGLLKLLILLSTRPGDWVMDPFCGSGTTLDAAHQLGRRWIGCDAGKIAVHVTWKRMLCNRNPLSGRWELRAPVPAKGSLHDLGLRRINGQTTQACRLPKRVDYWAMDGNFRNDFKNRSFAMREPKTGMLRELRLPNKRREKTAIDVVDSEGTRKRIVL